VTRRGGAATTDDLLDLGTHFVDTDRERPQHLRGDAFTFGGESEQEVFAADVVVTQESCLPLRQRRRAARDR
jgi:hypothetical protein